MLNNNYKNEAMKIMEQLKKAEETRMAMIKEAQETLVVLGAESTSNTIIENVININKGKIIAVETTVEVPVEKIIYVDKIVEKIIDNTDYTTIEELRSRNNELEVQLTNALNKIAELEMAAITVEPKIVEPAIDTTITVGPLTIEEIIVDEIIDKTEETIDAYLYILDSYFVSEEDRKITYKDSDTIILEKALKPIVDAFNNLSVEEQTEEQLNKLMDKNRVELKMRGAMNIIKDRKKEQIEFKTIKETKDSNKKGEYIYEVEGTFSLNEKDYDFIYNNFHQYPCIFGCFDMDIIKRVKNALESKFHMTDETDKLEITRIENDKKTRFDMDRKIFAYQSAKNIIKGYVEGYAFVWNTNEEIPCGATIKNALFNKYRKMNSSWGPGFVNRAQMIKDFCIENFDINFESTKEEIKQIVTNTTNDEINPDDLLE